MPVLARIDHRPAGNGDGTARSQMIADRLPVCYMSDFSILGLLVNRLEESIRLMEANGVHVISDGCCFEASVAGPDHLTGIVDLLTKGGIECQVSDLIDEVYQG